MLRKRRAGRKMGFQQNHKVLLAQRITLGCPTWAQPHRLAAMTHDPCLCREPVQQQDNKGVEQNSPPLRITICSCLHPLLMPREEQGGPATWGWGWGAHRARNTCRAGWESYPPPQKSSANFSISIVDSVDFVIILPTRTRCAFLLTEWNNKIILFKP